MRKLQNTDRNRAAVILKFSKACDHIEYAAEYNGISMTLELPKDRTIILPPLSVYTELYAKYLRHQGCFVQVSPDYTREDLETGKAESISKEYATFSAMAGQVLRLAGYHGEGIRSYLVPQTEGAEVEGMAAMVIRALLKQHSADTDRISLYTPYTEHLFLQKDWEQIWQLCMLGDAPVMSGAGTAESRTCQSEISACMGRYEDADFCMAQPDSKVSEPRISVWFSHGPAQQLLKPQYARCSAKAWLYPDFHDADGISVVLDPGERKGDSAGSHGAAFLVS